MTWLLTSADAAARAASGGHCDKEGVMRKFLRALVVPVVACSIFGSTVVSANAGNGPPASAPPAHSPKDNSPNPNSAGHAQDNSPNEASEGTGGNAGCVVLPVPGVSPGSGAACGN